MHIVAVGANHKTAPIELRDRLAFAPSHIPGALQTLSSLEHVAEAAILSTCNRTEIYAVCSRPQTQALLDFLSQNRGVRASELQWTTYRHSDERAVRHLFMVSAGADSMALGESEIVGQVRQAMEQALQAKAAGPVLSTLFQTALHVGKHARSETRIGKGAFSLGRCAVQLARSVFPDLRGRQILILGAGKMAETTAKHLAESGADSIIVTNRTLEHAEELAEALGGVAVPIEQLAHAARGAHILITSTAAPHVVLTRAEMSAIMRARERAPLLVIDLAVPRDVDPRAGRLKNLHLYDIDDLQGIAEAHAASRRAEIAKVDAIVADHVAEFMLWLRSLSAAPLIAALTEKFEAVRRYELERHKKSLNRLSEQDRALVERITASLVKKLLHTPIVRIKHDLGGAEPVVRRLFGLDKESEEPREK